MIGSAPIGGAPIAALLGVGVESLDVTLTDSLGFAPGVSVGSTVSAADTFTISDSISAGALVSLIETILITGDAQDLADLDTVISETFELSDPTAPGYLRAAVVAEVLQMATQSAGVRGYLTDMVESLQITDSSAFLYGTLLVERLRMVETVSPNTISNMALGDITRLVDAILRTYPEEMSEVVAMEQTMLAQAAVQILERLRLVDTMIGVARYRLGVAEAFRLADGLLRFFGADLADGMVFGQTLVARTLAIATATETLTVGDAIAPRLLIAATTAEGVEIDAVQALTALYQPVMLEGFSLTAGYVSPDGTVTTWAMNTRSGAVTEYSDYNFNSFTRIGNKYYGAAADGLYELHGDTDDGDDIIARIRSGFMQFGGTRLSRLKSAYIAARGEGDFVLRIETAEGVQYDYAVATRNMRSTKVHMGKGQRARYFAFELISAGQDFDLDTLEFVPIVVQRRV